MTRDAVAIEVEGLGRRFGDFQAVRDVSFQVARGEIVTVHPCRRGRE
jgi:ABC-type Na+ transport system ATPase subunit NatA